MTWLPSSDEGIEILSTLTTHFSYSRISDFALYQPLPKRGYDCSGVRQFAELESLFVCWQFPAQLHRSHRSYVG